MIDEALENSLSKEAADKLAAALTEKALAEAAKFDSEKKRADLDSERYKLSVERESFVVERERHNQAEWHANDMLQHVHYFIGVVNEGTVGRCLGVLDLWDRMDPGCDITIVFNSPGGSVTDGMALFDHIQVIRGNGHKVTTIAEGEAASMAGILLQAGDHRIMGRESWVLIHQASFGAMGSTYKVEDMVEWVKRVQNRIVDIFVTRAKEAGEAGTASKPLTTAFVKKNWERKDWWISSDECLKYGIVDEVQ